MAVDSIELVRILNGKPHSLTRFLSELDQVLKPSVDFHRYQNIHDYIYVLNELEAVRQDRRFDFNLQMSANRSFDSVRVKCSDDFAKDHRLHITLGKDRRFQIIEHTLPDIKLLNAHFDGLKLAIDAFLKCILDIRDYFEAMDGLDENCWIVDPIRPTHKQNYRRIMIDKDVSILVTVDVAHANKPPNIKVLGPSKLTDLFYEKIQENIDKWNDQNSFVSNLSNLLGLSKFPQKEIIVDDKIVETECCICFASRNVRGMLPSVKCERPACLQSYHSDCLYQWLVALSGTVKFNTIHGECPSCSFSISCPVVNCDS